MADRPALKGCVDPSGRIPSISVSPAPPPLAGALAPPQAKSTQAKSNSPALTISHARSLRALPLDLLRTSSWVDQWPVRLDAGELATLLDTLRASSESASARLADNAMAHLVASAGGARGRGAGNGPPQCPRDVVAALHRILTRSRFLKGSRSCFPLETAMTQMIPSANAGSRSDDD